MSATPKTRHAPQRFPEQFQFQWTYPISHAIRNVLVSQFCIALLSITSPISKVG